MTLRRNNEAVFTANMIKKWKVVPVKITTLVANECHRGINYMGFNKTEIYRSFAKLNSLGAKEPPQIHQFIPLMNAIADIVNEHNQSLFKEIEKSIKFYTKNNEQYV